MLTSFYLKASPPPTQFGSRQANVAYPGNLSFPPYREKSREQVKGTLGLDHSFLNQGGRPFLVKGVKGVERELFGTIKQLFSQIFSAKPPETISYPLNSYELDYLDQWIDLMDENQLKQITVNGLIHFNDDHVKEEDAVSHFHTVTVKRVAEGLQIHGVDNEPGWFRFDGVQRSVKSHLLYHSQTGICEDNTIWKMKSPGKKTGVYTPRDFSHSQGFMALVESLWPAFASPEGRLQTDKPEGKKVFATITTTNNKGQVKTFKLSPKYNKDGTERTLPDVLETLKQMTHEYLKKCGVWLFYPMNVPLNVTV